MTSSTDGATVNTVKRIYHLDEKALKEYWAKRETLGGFINPMGRKGAYMAQVQVLMDLGVDTWHPMADILKQLPVTMKGMGDGIWLKFSKREEREGAKMPKPFDARVLQNFEVLQRLNGQHPYGLKLRQAHASIDIRYIPRGEDLTFNDANPIKGLKGTFWFLLNTTHTDFDAVEPYNSYKGRRRGRPKRRSSK